MNLVKGQRADRALVAAGLFESRAKAGEAIEAGLVTVDGEVVAKAATPIRAGAVLQARPAYPWVSRGGVKLAHALDLWPIDPSGRLCLDVGASTGGFTQVLLARGASHVLAVEVGHGQLHPSLSADPRVTLLEGTDIRRLAPQPEPCGLVVIDVSFISLTLVLPALMPHVAAAADLVALVKPQFEAGPQAVKRGIVRDAAVHATVCRTVAECAARLGWEVLGLAASPIAGREGNGEFLLGARRGAAR